MPIRKGYFERRGYSKTSRLIGFMICNVVRGGIAIIPIIFYNQVFSTTTNVSAAYMGVTLFFCSGPLGVGVNRLQPGGIGAGMWQSTDSHL
jgi:ascorbate-specific PTS system EIIC-type component UlaA